MGVIDMAFNSKSTLLAVSCMDSTIRNYDLNTSNLFIKQLLLLTSSVKSWKIGRLLSSMKASSLAET